MWRPSCDGTIKATQERVGEQNEKSLCHNRGILEARLLLKGMLLSVRTGDCVIALSDDSVELETEKT